MELRSQKRLMVFSGSANEPLAEEVARILGVELGGVERSVFANGEIYIHYTESVRGADAFVIQSHTQPLNFNIMEQLIMIDALKRASAKRITAVMPFYGYARQDKKGRPREPISARLMGDLFRLTERPRRPMEQELLEIMRAYRQQLVPLIVPVTLFNHYVRKYEEPYLARQVYLQPHPVELKLRNHV